MNGVLSAIPVIHPQQQSTKMAATMTNEEIVAALAKFPDVRTADKGRTRKNQMAHKIDPGQLADLIDEMLEAAGQEPGLHFNPENADAEIRYEVLSRIYKLEFTKTSKKADGEIIYRDIWAFDPATQKAVKRVIALGSTEQGTVQSSSFAATTQAELDIQNAELGEASWSYKLRDGQAYKAPQLTVTAYPTNSFWKFSEGPNGEVIDPLCDPETGAPPAIDPETGKPLDMKPNNVIRELAHFSKWFEMEVKKAFERGDLINPVTEDKRKDKLARQLFEGVGDFDECSSAQKTKVEAARLAETEGFARIPTKMTGTSAVLRRHYGSEAGALAGRPCNPKAYIRFAVHKTTKEVGGQYYGTIYTVLDVDTIRAGPDGQPVMDEYQVDGETLTDSNAHRGLSYGLEVWGCYIGDSFTVSNFGNSVPSKILKAMVKRPEEGTVADAGPDISSLPAHLLAGLKKSEPAEPAAASEPAEPAAASSSEPAAEPSAEPSAEPPAEPAAASSSEPAAPVDMDSLAM